jgi:hypothetical protein
MAGKPFPDGFCVSGLYPPTADRPDRIINGLDNSKLSFKMLLVINLYPLTSSRSGIQAMQYSK